MKTYRFTTDLRCFLRNGETQVIRGYEVAVEAETRSEARCQLASIATDMVDDAGSRLTDAPLDCLVVISAREAA